MLTKGQVAFSGLVPGLKGLIKAWEPGPLQTELRFRDSFLSFLRANVPADCRVEREYRHHGTTIDIFLEWRGLVFNDEIYFEVKRNLNKKPMLDRLVGQVESLQPGKHTILILLIGDTDPALLQRLKAKYAAYEESQYEKPIAVVLK